MFTWNIACPMPWRWCWGSTKKSRTQSGCRVQYALLPSRRYRVLCPVFSSPSKHTLHPMQQNLLVKGTALPGMCP